MIVQLRGRSQLSTFMYSYRAYGGGGGHDASVLFLNVDLLLMLAAMVDRMQRHVTDCCGTVVIYKTLFWERFDVTMPASSFGLNSYCDPFRTY